MNKRPLPTGIGVIGCGNISQVYLENLTQVFCDMNVKAVSDIDISKAAECAGKFNIPKACSTEELLQDDEIGYVLNLTVPNAHAEVGMQILKAGKGLYSEKPLAVDLKDGIALLREAEKRNLPIGGAPDTFIGAAVSTCRQLIVSGKIGTPISVSCFMVGGGPEDWHPNPDFFYKKGGGPLFDMAPYYLSVLISLLGPVESLFGMSSRCRKERVVESDTDGERIFPVEIDTHYQGVLKLKSGVLANLTFSFDGPGGTGNYPIEIVGSEATLQVPDPNWFGGTLRIRKRNEDEFQDVHLINNQVENLRGLGFRDMILSDQEGKNHTANGDLQCHVLEIMHGLVESSRTGLLYQCKKMAVE